MTFQINLGELSTSNSCSKQTDPSYLDIDSLPGSSLLSGKQAAPCVGVTEGTLSVWRCTGRYDLPYVKSGRLVRYRVSDIREFIASRVHLNTGDSA